VRYRTTDARARMAGGSVYYLSHGVGGRFGRALGWLFALFVAIAAFGFGNMVRSNSVADVLPSSFDFPNLIGLLFSPASSLARRGTIGSGGGKAGQPFTHYLSRTYGRGGSGSGGWGGRRTAKSGRGWFAVCLCAAP
jgi:amino acid transporter